MNKWMNVCIHAGCASARSVGKLLVASTARHHRKNAYLLDFSHDLLRFKKLDVLISAI